MNLRRSTVVFVLVAAVVACALTRGLVGAPNYTDAYYHFNAAVRVAEGQGLTESYLWTYIGAPESLAENGVTPSHLYWMPMTSLLAAAGMTLFNPSGDVAFAYGAAQIPLALMFFGTVCVGYWLGKQIGGGERHAWVAGLLTLFSGYYTRFWGMTDTFAPYALFGSLCLLMMGKASVGATHWSPLQQRRYVYWLAAGALAGLAHLTRADGLLFLFIGYLVIFWGVWARPLWRQRLVFAAIMTIAYLLVMLPWFVRNMNAIGAPLPLGGAQSMWFTQYDDLFNFPPQATAQTLFSLGTDGVLRTRWEAFAGPQGLFSGNLGTFIAVEGLVVMTPLMLIGLWQRRKLAFLRPFWLYALGLHVVMTLVFPYPGYRGGLLHSAAALVPWWAALGVAGLDDLVIWVARRRRRWNPSFAKSVFSAALVAVAVLLSLSLGLRTRVMPSVEIPALYAELQARLPSDARIIMNDPAALYYYTGMGGVVTPNADPSIIEDIARRYHVNYLLLEPGGIPGKLLSAYDDPPPFLSRLEFSNPDVRLYAIDR